jgi:hypothetical protein
MQFPRIANVLKRTFASRRYATTIDHDPEILFNYTSGRWLWNEELQMRSRQRKFNIAELAQAAARAVGSPSCIKIAKLSEGNFNKAFLLTMDDGKEIVAKLPNPNAGYAHFTTASEAATMDYAWNVLNVPVPQVLAWNSTMNNPVGAKYILMERCAGIELHKIWSKVTDRQKAVIIREIVNYEATFASSGFPSYGSLYYAKDLHEPEDDHRILSPPGKLTKFQEFAIGPTTDRGFFDHGRAGATANQGTWSTVEEYNLAIAERELSCLAKSSRFPYPQGFYNGPGQYQQSSHTKLQNLQNFQKVASHLKPVDPILSTPVLWHADLHWDNIFVDESDPTQITAIIDWQAVHVAPLFAQAQHPEFLEFDGEIPDTYDAKAIKLPDNFEDLSEEEQQAAKKLRGAQILWKLYELELVRQCNDVKRAIGFGEGLLGRLPTHAGNIFSDGELLVQDFLINIQEQWDDIVDDPVATPCPLSFTDEDKAAHAEQFLRWSQSIELMTEFLMSIGGYRGWDGSVSHEQYDAAKKFMKRYKEEFIAQHSSTEEERSKWLEAWPFPDP